MNSQKRGADLKKLVPPIEIRSALEREAFEMRDGLIAFEQGYDLANVLSLSPLAQEIYWKLAGKGK
jgi:hypothetical protein